MKRLRLKAFAFVLGIVLAAIGMLSLFTVPAWPVVGVAVAFVAFGLNQMTARLSVPTCLGCGANISGQPVGDYGVVCKDCGAVNQMPRTRDVA